jgi:galactofuranosylgalactofuranosylrhamnosyl-N-acetylglucosaminyl-diphospho-decaprenol beta-1,5/1,6-galactofuranosyltransferase
VDRIDSGTGESDRIVSVVLAGCGETLFVPLPPAVASETRLVLSLRLITEARILDLTWSTSTPPEHKVVLTAIICTFNRERDVAATLESLLIRPSGVTRVIVVNQGRPGLAARLADMGSAIEGGRLLVIEQANLGGAGGFGRGMLEAAADDDCTHVVLMDDDIDLDTAIFARLTVLLSYLRSGLAVGGAMLDRENRRTIFSVGDVLHPSKPEICNVVDPISNDIAERSTTAYLAKHHRIDFNGWWFFALSKKDMTSKGLPLPLFIRGDDVEYGYRLMQSGIFTVGWPGLAVWHDPFYAKRHPWHYFYDRRNSLFLCEMHGRLGRWRLLGSLHAGFASHLLRFDYARATCIALGLKAFNDGVDALVEWNGDEHQNLIQEFGSRDVPAAGLESPKRIGKSRLPATLLYIIRLTHDLFVATKADPIKAAPLIAYDDWRPTIRRRPLQARIVHEESGSLTHVVHDRGQAWACVLRFGREWVRFAIRPWRRERLIALTHPDFWAQYTRSSAVHPQSLCGDHDEIKFPFRSSRGPRNR